VGSGSRLPVVLGDSRWRPLVRVGLAGRPVGKPFVDEVPIEFEASKDRRESAAHVDDQHLKLRVAIEHAGGDHPRAVDGRVEGAAIRTAPHEDGIGYKFAPSHAARRQQRLWVEGRRAGEQFVEHVKRENLQCVRPRVADALGRGNSEPRLPGRNHLCSH